MYSHPIIFIITFAVTGSHMYLSLFCPIYLFLLYPNIDIVQMAYLFFSIQIGGVLYKEYRLPLPNVSLNYLHAQ